MFYEELMMDPQNVDQFKLFRRSSLQSNHPIAH